MPINYSEIMAYALECKNMLYPIVSSSVYVILCYLLKLRKNDFSNLYKNIFSTEILLNSVVLHTMYSWPYSQQYFSFNVVN